MQRTVAELAQGAEMDVQLRVGVNTGEVFVGGMSAGGDFTAMGDAVNVASRLQTSAEPGAVVVGPATYYATSNVIAYEELEPLQAKGREELVSRWRAIASLVLPGRRPSQRRSPLVGRDNEVALLRSMLATSLARSRPSVAVMFGEPGVGKTRLAEEVARDGAHRTRRTRTRRSLRSLRRSQRVVARRRSRASSVRSRAPTAIRATPNVHARIHARLAELTGLEADDPELDRLVAGLVYVLGDPNALDRCRPCTRASRSAPRRRSAGAGFGAPAAADDRAGRAALGRRRGARPRSTICSNVPSACRCSCWRRRASDLENALGAARGQTQRGGDAPRPARRRRRHPAARRSARRRTRRSKSMRLVMERAGGNPLFLEELAGLLTDVPGDGATVNDLPATLRGLVAARIDGLESAPGRSSTTPPSSASDGRVDALAALAQRPRGERSTKRPSTNSSPANCSSEDAGALVVPVRAGPRGRLRHADQGRTRPSPRRPRPVADRAAQGPRP